MICKRFEPYNGCSYTSKNIYTRKSPEESGRCCQILTWHADRIFKELTGRSPFEYIRANRLSQAAINLRDSSPKNKDHRCALDYLFDSHEGFTRAFSKQFGVAPKSYQQKPKPIALFMPYKVLPTHKQTGKRRDATMNKNNEQLVYLSR
jgi:AraC-like DNA-binding protein